MRTLAIDLGSRRVGLALSDFEGKFANTYNVLSVKSTNDALAPIVRLISSEGVARVIVGLPLNMDDSIGPAAEQAIEWGHRLGKMAGIPVLFVDERLSSFEAEQRLAERKRGGEKITRARRKQTLDALAASTFLQQYLDGKATAMEL